MSRLEWAFAGTSHTSPLDSVSDSNSNDPIAESGTSDKSMHGKLRPYRSVWNHWVDSRTDTPKPDEADMYTLLNGDVLERGYDKDPVSGRVVSEYEELWRDLPVFNIEGERVSVVLRMQDDVHGARGMVVRVGGWCQGFVKIGGEITVERWGWADRPTRSTGAAQSNPAHSIYHR